VHTLRLSHTIRRFPEKQRFFAGNREIQCERSAISDQPSASFVGEDDGYGEKTSVSPHLPIFECSTGLATIASSGKKLIADGSLLIAHR
jgi:hypothetical protein